MDIYNNGFNDQPTTCPKCGSRTYMTEIRMDYSQVHECNNIDCKYVFIMDFELEDDEVDEFEDGDDY